MSKIRIIGVLLVVIVAVLGLVITNIGAILAWLGGAIEFILFPGSRIDPATIVPCSESATCSVVHPIVFTLVVFFVVLTGFAYTTLLERKLIAAFQQRSGPNRVGPGGFLQPAADAVKLIFKEDIIPAQAYKAVYYLAPLLKVVPVLMLVAVIPMGPSIIVPGFAPALGDVWYRVPLHLIDVNVGVLYLIGVTSLATYGVVLAGWSSNNKYAMLGGLRASAQMVSYELSLGLVLTVPVMIAGSMSLGDIISIQANPWEWLVFQNPLAAGILIITLYAEVNRSPFDLPEAEQELTAGHMTEYSGMKFALFMMAEYLGMIAAGFIAASMFFGGYHLIPVDYIPIAGPLNMIIKVVLFLSLFIWVRATLPRLRYDRLMTFGWKILLPLSLLSVAWTAISIVVGDAFGGSTAYGIASGIFFVVVLVGGYILMRAAGEEQETVEEVDMADDPMITGERSGISWALLNLLGGLVAIPFVLVNTILDLLDGIARSGEMPAGMSDETAIEPVESPSGGD